MFFFFEFLFFKARCVFDEKKQEAYQAIELKAKYAVISFCKLCWHQHSSIQPRQVIKDSGTDDLCLILSFIIYFHHCANIKCYCCWWDGHTVIEKFMVLVHTTSTVLMFEYFWIEISQFFFFLHSIVNCEECSIEVYSTITTQELFLEK